MAFIAAAGYVAFMSVVLGVLMYIDKQRAINNEWRVSEKSLFTLAFLGGAIGGVLGMYLCRHKTKHNSFAFGFPLIAAVQVFLLVQLYNM